MITEAILHCPQIGPARQSKLREQGIRTWHQIRQHAEDLPTTIRGPVLEEIERCLSAFDDKDIGYFVENFASKDRWRILAHYLDEVSFFDIETAGLEYDDPVTVIACWHRGDVHLFVEHENLDDFLDLLDDVTLLSSFNGSTFDVPRVLDAFHIPDLPCPHLDLRWLCYHQGLRGGLKEITWRLNIVRPPDLQQVRGEHAIRMWARWEHFRDRQARDELLRYCASDVLLLVVLADELSGRPRTAVDELWTKLPPVVAGSEGSNVPDPAQGNLKATFGDASPTKLRGRRRWAI